jgi:hypothetical protein
VRLILNFEKRSACARVLKSHHGWRKRTAWIFGGESGVPLAPIHPPRQQRMTSSTTGKTKCWGRGIIIIITKSTKSTIHTHTTPRYTQHRQNIYRPCCSLERLSEPLGVFSSAVAHAALPLYHSDAFPLLRRSQVPPNSFGK